jgi:hypothetical protein
MEDNTKHSLSILRHPDSASTHLIHSVSDLSSLRVVNSLGCDLSSSLGLCVCVLRIESCVCCFSFSYFCVSFVIITVRARGSNLWRFLANGRKSTMKKVVVFKLIIGSLERG